MKQCPNPNCILYTRLEELPDAYVKCPGCGGQLVDSALTSSLLRSGHLTRMPSGPLSQMDLDQEFENAFPGQSPAQQEADSAGASSARNSPGNSQPAPPPPQQYTDDEYYPYDEAQQQDAIVEAAPLGLSRAGRLAYVLGALLLLFACVLFTFVVLTRVFPQQAKVAGPQATETAIAAQRPAVNTPIAVLPTVPDVGFVESTPTTVLPPALPPTQGPVPSTDTPVDTPVPPPTSTAEAPTPASQPPTEPPAPQPPTPTSSQPVAPTSPIVPTAPTAPPLQPQPVGGVIRAIMAAGLQGGQPIGNVSAYKPNDPFILAVQAQYGPGGVTSVRTRWYGPDGGLLYELPRDFTQSGTFYSAFTLRKSNAWAVGGYRVDIHTNNSPSPAYSVTFSVVP